MSYILFLKVYRIEITEIRMAALSVVKHFIYSKIAIVAC